MSTPDALIQSLAQRGVRLERRGERLHVEAPAGALTADDRDALREHKPAILAALTPALTVVDPTTSTVCTWCGNSPADGGLDAAGGAWCTRCRDAETAAQRTPPAVADNLRAAHEGAVLELAELAGFPRLPYKPGHAVSPGAALWRIFIGRAALPDLRRALEALRDHLAAIPMPEPVTPSTRRPSPTLADGTPANRCPDCGEPTGTAARCPDCATARASQDGAA